MAVRLIAREPLRHSLQLEHRVAGRGQVHQQVLMLGSGNEHELAVGAVARAFAAQVAGAAADARGQRHAIGMPVSCLRVRSSHRSPASGAHSAPNFSAIA